MIITTTSSRVTLSFLCAVFTLLMAHTLVAQNTPWTLVGPYGGRVTSIVSIGSSVFAGTFNNGIFKSTDNGDHWQQIPYRFQTNSARKLLTHNSLLFSIGDRVYRSADDGATWTEISRGLDFRPDALCFMGDTLYAAVHEGDIYSSADNGTNWQFVGHAPGVWTSILASHERTLFFSADSGLYRSDDGGRTWGKAPVPGGGKSVRAFAAHDAVLVITIGDPSIISDEIYRSTDNGATWSPGNSGITADRIRSIIWDGERFIATGGYFGGVFVSTTGANWQKIDGGFTDEINTIWSTGTTLFAGSGDEPDGGIYRSTDNGITWELSHEGFSSININGIAEHDGALFAVGYHGAYISRNNGATWTRPAGASPFEDMATVASTNDALFTGMNYWGSGVGGGIYRTTNGGDSWSRVDPGFGEVPAITTSGNLVGALMRDAETWNYGFQYSTDNGAWSARTIPVAGSFNDFPTDIRFVGKTLFLSTYQGMFRSLDTGTTWQAVNIGISSLRFTTLGGTDNVVLAGAHTADRQRANLLRSTDNGDSWQLMYSSIHGEEVVTSIASYGSTIVASFGTSGIVRSIDNGATWEPFNNGLTNIRTEFVRFAAGSLFSSTGHGGIYRTAIPSGVEREKDMAGTATTLLYPNPCRTSATIRYDVPHTSGVEGARVVLGIYNVLGGQVKTVVSSHQTPGTYSMHIDVSGLASGTYFYRLNIGASHESHPFLVMDNY